MLRASKSVKGHQSGSATGRKIYNMIELFESCSMIFILIPMVYVHGMCNVIPMLTVEYEFGLAKQWMHILLATFVFINVAGNYIMSVLTDTTLSYEDQETDEWTFCELCQKRRPPRCWHCQHCNKCILKRDHHCMFMASCIGYYNFRFFVAYLGYLSFALIYSLYYNYYYFKLDHLSSSEFMFLFVSINPLIGFIVNFADMGVDFTNGFSIEMVAVYMLFIHFILILWVSSMFGYHLWNVFKGWTVKEHRKGVIRYNLGWKYNFVDVFGVKWYLAIICPFVSSPLPGDGLKWIS